MTQPPGAPPTVRDNLLTAALALLDDHGPDALQTRRIATAAGTSTMAVYTHFGGMPALIAAVADRGLDEFDAALTLPDTADPVADLLSCGTAYRRFAIERPHLYRLMFGSTSAHGINAPARDIRAGEPARDLHPSLLHLVRLVRRAVTAGRITATGADDEAAVLAIAAQFWTMMHGFVMLELAGFYGSDGTAVPPVLGALAAHTLIGLGDTAQALQASLRASTARP